MVPKHLPGPRLASCGSLNEGHTADPSLFEQPFVVFLKVERNEWQLVDGLCTPKSLKLEAVFDFYQLSIPVPAPRPHVEISVLIPRTPWNGRMQDLEQLRDVLKEASTNEISRRENSPEGIKGDDPGQDVRVANFEVILEFRGCFHALKKTGEVFGRLRLRISRAPRDELIPVVYLE
jgi:hypothetical protein